MGVVQDATGSFPAGLFVIAMGSVVAGRVVLALGGFLTSHLWTHGE